MDGLTGLSKLPSGLSSMITPPFHLFIINLFPFNKQGNKAIAYEFCLYNKIKIDIMQYRCKIWSFKKPEKYTNKGFQVFAQVKL